MCQNFFRQKIIWIWPGLLGALLLLSTCNGATVTPPAPVFLRAAGSTAAAPLLTALANAYVRDQPHITLDVQGGGSHLGRQLVEAGQVEFGMVSRRPEDLPERFQTIVLGKDAIAMILHPQNPVSGLALVELQAIFSGRTLNWQAVGGADQEIQVVSREDGSGTRAIFEAAVMKEQPVTPTAIVLPNSQAVVDFVASTPGAVGYVSFYFAQAGNVVTVPLEGLVPDPANLNDGSYPLSRELAVIVAQPARPEVRDFIEFAQSPAGQQIVGQHWGRMQ